MTIFLEFDRLNKEIELFVKEQIAIALETKQKKNVLRRRFLSQ